jgi:glycosyltransferase involved in cell wall biosynthesis
MVFEVRDIWPLLLTENGGFNPRNPFVMFLGWIEWLGYRYADRIVGTMPNLVAHVERVLGFRREVHCVPMGLPEELLADDGTRFPQALEAVFPRAEFVLTHAGSVGVDNALDTLFEAARILQHESKIAFFIIGSGDLMESYRLRCADLPNVVFADAVENKFVQPVLRRSTALYFAAHPTIVLDYGQSLNKLVDYMFSGRPILGSYSGFPSMINDAKCGEFVPAGDAQALARAVSEWAAREPSELTDMGLRGRNWIVRYRSYERLADDYEALLDINRAKQVP